jgi:hypothetical protein
MSAQQQYESNGTSQQSRQHANFYGQEVDDDDEMDNFGEEEDLIPDFPSGAAGAGDDDLDGSIEGTMDEGQAGEYDNAFPICCVRLELTLMPADGITSLALLSS